MPLQSYMEGANNYNWNCDPFPFDPNGTSPSTPSQASFESSNRQEGWLRGATGWMGNLTQFDQEVDNPSSEVLSAAESSPSSSGTTNSTLECLDRAESAPRKAFSVRESDDPILNEKRRRNRLAAEKCRLKRKLLEEEKDAKIKRIKEKIRIKKAMIQERDVKVRKLEQENESMRLRLSLLEQSQSGTVASVSGRPGVHLAQPLPVSSQNLGEHAHILSGGQRLPQEPQLQSYLKPECSSLDSQRVLSSQTTVHSNSAPNLSLRFLHSAERYPTRMQTDQFLSSKPFRSGTFSSTPNGEAKPVMHPLRTAPQTNTAQMFRQPPRRELSSSYRNSLQVAQRCSVPSLQPPCSQQPVQPHQVHPSAPYPPQMYGSYASLRQELPRIELNGDYCAHPASQYNWNAEPGAFASNDTAAISSSQSFVQYSSDAGTWSQNATSFASQMQSPPVHLSPGQTGIEPETTFQYSRLSFDSEANQVHEELLSSSLPAAKARSIPDMVTFHEGWNPGPSKLRKAAEIELLERQFDAMSVDDFVHIAKDMLLLPGEMPHISKGRKSLRGKFNRWFSKFRPGRDS